MKTFSNLSFGVDVNSRYSFVERNLAKAEHTLSTFLNNEAAFSDITNSSSEYSILKDISATDFLVRFITHMLSNRLIQSNLCGSYIVKRATRVLPKGVHPI